MSQASTPSPDHPIPPTEPAADASEHQPVSITIDVETVVSSPEKIYSFPAESSPQNATLPVGQKQQTAANISGSTPIQALSFDVSDDAPTQKAHTPSAKATSILPKSPADMPPPPTFKNPADVPPPPTFKNPAEMSPPPTFKNPVDMPPPPTFKNPADVPPPPAAIPPSLASSLAQASLVPPPRVQSQMPAHEANKLDIPIHISETPPPSSTPSVPPMQVSSPSLQPSPSSVSSRGTVTSLPEESPTPDMASSKKASPFETKSLHPTSTPPTPPQMPAHPSSAPVATASRPPTVTASPAPMTTASLPPTAMASSLHGSRMTSPASVGVPESMRVQQPPFSTPGQAARQSLPPTGQSLPSTGLTDPTRQPPPSQAQALPVHTHVPRQGSGDAQQPPQARLAAFIAPTPDELAQVRQIMQLLHRSYQAFEFYPLNHPLVQQLSDQLFNVLRGFFRFRDMLELRLERFRVIYGGQVIFEEQGLNNNVTYLLYSDGIRKLIIDAGLSAEEYMRFFHVLHRSSTRRSVFEDTITLLWEQQLAHIRYFLVEDLTELYSPDMQALYQNMQQSQIPAAQKPAGSSSALPIMQQMAALRLHPSPEEKQALQRLISDEERGLMRRFLEIVARVLEHEDELLQLERLVRVLSQLQPILLSAGEIDHLALCLYYTSRLSNIFAQRNSAKAQQWHQTLQQILQEAYSENVIHKLVTLLDQNPHNESTKQEVERYIQYLEPPNADTLLLAFTWAESFATRHFLCQMLAAKYKDQSRQLANGVYSDSPAVIRHTCMILGEIGHPAARPHLQKAAQHSDPDVRVEATRALLQCGGSTAVQPQMLSLLRKNLVDDNVEVRRSALQGLPQIGQHAVELLRGLFNNRLYEQWSEEDQRLLFDTTVRLGQRFHESLEFLIQALCKQYSGWLAGRKDLTTARIAIQTLQRNGSPRAIAAIEQLYNSGVGPLRQVCEELTQRML